jgi:hypothetical protein
MVAVAGARAKWGLVLDSKRELAGGWVVTVKRGARANGSSREESAALCWTL